MTSRPTPEQRAVYEAAWATYSTSTTDGAVRTVLHLASTTPAVHDFLREQFVAACFLEDHLKMLDTTADYRQERCFTFGRLCVGNRDVWAVFDKMLAHSQETHRLLQERKARLATPLLQSVPPPTKLLTSWYEYAKNSRGDQGVYPQVFFHRDESDAWTIEALALNGKDVFDHVATVVQAKRPAEFAFGVDMSSLPGQDLTREDFLVLVWGFADGNFYSGIVEYQPKSKGDAFDPIRWDNNYWNHSMHEDYFPKLRGTPA